MPRRRPPPAPLLLALLVLGSLLGMPPREAPARETPAGPTPGPVDAALEQLASPAVAVRQAGVRRLVAQLPGVRDRLVALLPEAPWSVQVHLIQVLAHDGSEQAVAALLAHLVRTDPTQAVAIVTGLAGDREVAQRLLARWREDPEGFTGAVARTPAQRERVRLLVRRLRRGEIEDLLISRKSRTGSTGYYEGQYDILQGKDREPDFRRHALEVVTGIALDEAVRTPANLAGGLYRFVRPHAVEAEELRSMALHAVSELCRRDDLDVVARLEDRHVEIVGRQAELYRRALRAWHVSRGDYEAKPFQDALLEWNDVLGEHLDMLACLHAIEPQRHAMMVRRFIDELKAYDWPVQPIYRWSYIAGLLIRVGWYDEAIDAYRMAARRGSAALAYYNMACAAASASKEPGLSPAERDGRLNWAVAYLEQAVTNGWSDVGWMQEDRDLEPVREHRANAWAFLLERIREEFLPPAEGDEPK